MGYLYNNNICVFFLLELFYNVNKVFKYKWKCLNMGPYIINGDMLLFEESYL